MKKLEDKIKLDISIYKHRNDYRSNQEKILYTLSELTKKKTTPPTVSNIAAVTNLSRTTIYKHLQALKEDIAEYRDARIDIQRETLMNRLYTILKDNTSH